MLLLCWLLTSVAVALLTSTPTAVAGLSLSLRSLVLWVTTALVMNLVTTLELITILRLPATLSTHMVMVTLLRLATEPALPTGSTTTPTPVSTTPALAPPLEQLVSPTMLQSSPRTDSPLLAWEMRALCVLILQQQQQQQQQQLLHLQQQLL